MSEYKNTIGIEILRDYRASLEKVAEEARTRVASAPTVQANFAETALSPARQGIIYVQALTVLGRDVE